MPKVHEKSYPTHDLEFVTVVFALKIWPHNLNSVHVDMLTDHKSLEQVFLKKNLIFEGKSGDKKILPNVELNR